MVMLFCVLLLFWVLYWIVVSVVVVGVILRYRGMFSSDWLLVRVVLFNVVMDNDSCICVVCVVVFIGFMLICGGLIMVSERLVFVMLGRLIVSVCSVKVFLLLVVSSVLDRMFSVLI